MPGGGLDAADVDDLLRVLSSAVKRRVENVREGGKEGGKEGDGRCWKLSSGADGCDCFIKYEGADIRGRKDGDDGVHVHVGIEDTSI